MKKANRQILDWMLARKISNRDMSALNGLIRNYISIFVNTPVKPEDREMSISEFIALMPSELQNAVLHYAKNRVKELRARDTHSITE